MPFDGITIFSDKTTDSTTLTEKTPTDKTAPVFAEAYIFEDMRMEVRNERSKMTEQLTAKMTSDDYTAEEKNAAFDEMAQLTKQTSNEALMEMQIKAFGYPEAFVRTEDGVVKVTVLSTEGQSPKMAAEIIQYVKTSWEDAGKVEVSFTGDAK